MLGNLPVIGEHVEQQAGLSTEIDLRNFTACLPNNGFTPAGRRNAFYCQKPDITLYLKPTWVVPFIPRYSY